VHFFEGAWPLLVLVGPQRMASAEVDEMLKGFDRYFERGERYALLTVMPRGIQLPGARERKQMVDWASSATVRDFTAKLCVGAATLVTNPLMQGALTAILWLWKPPSPHAAVRSVSDGLDFCLERLAAERIPMAESPSVMRGAVDDELREIL